MGGGGVKNKYICNVAHCFIIVADYNTYTPNEQRLSYTA